MKRKLIAIGIFAVLTLVMGLNTNATTIKSRESENCVELNVFMLSIQDLFDNIENDFSEKEYNELRSQVEFALEKATIVDENGCQVVDLKVFQGNLNFQPTGRVRNVIRFYDLVCISAVPGSYSTLRTPYDGYFFNWQYDWIYKSDSYKLEIYKDWDAEAGQFPSPKGEPALYAKKAYFKGWIGPHIPPEAEDGLLGVVGDVFVIGSTTEPQVRARPVHLLFLRLSERFPIPVSYTHLTLPTN